MPYVFAILISLWLLALCYEDLRHRRLPNALTLGGAAVALVWRLGAGSWPAFLSGLSGGMLASLLLILPFLLHSAGGGDVKMLFAAGAVVGRGGVLVLLLYVSLAGLAGRLLMVTREKQGMTFAQSLWGMLPVLLYGILYIRKILYAPAEKRWDDFYGFNRKGKWKISFAAMAAGTFAVCMALMALQNA